MSTLVLPVGHYLGVHHGVDDIPIHVVRAGWRLARLDSDRHLTVWAMAHGMPEGEWASDWTADDTVGAARGAGVPDAAAVLDDLRSDALVLDADTDSAAAGELVAACRLRALFRGLDGGAEAGAHRPDRHPIGPGPGQVAAWVDAFTFEVWKWAPHCDSLWHTCEILARAAGTPDPAVMVAPCLGAAQTLLAHGAAYLDEARPDRRDADNAGVA